MGDTWAYRAIWEIAGLTPPNYHEDDIQAMCDLFDQIGFAIADASNDVTYELAQLESKISADSFDALHGLWNGRGKVASMGLAHSLHNISQGLYRVLEEIQEWKTRIFVSLGISEAAIAPAIALRAGVGVALKSMGFHLGEAELRRMLEGLVDDLEAKLVSTIIDGTPLKDLQHRVAAELQQLLDASIDKAGKAAGTYAGS